MSSLRPTPLVGFVAGLGGVLLVAIALGPFHAHLARATPALVLVVPVAAAGVLGGRLVGALVAVIATAVFLVAFIPPVGSIRIDVREDTVALVLFLVVAMGASVAMATEAERRRSAQTRVDELTEMHARLQRTIEQRDALEAETNRLLVLDEVDRQRRALLRAVSHELRTPLAAIHAVATDLRSGTVFDHETRARLLDAVCAETERLDRIVANLLSFSRIESGALAPDREPIDLADVIDGCRRRSEGLFRAIPLDVDLDGVPAVFADFVQIDQVMTNLIENAVKHSPPEGTIRVRAVVDEPDVAISVSDDGPGVEEGLRDLVFEPFRAERGGTGIGLAICRAIVEGHGGTIRLGAEDGGGATFVFTLPVAR